MAMQQKDNPFYNATRDVFKSMLDLDITRMQENEVPRQEESVRVEIALTGDLSGSVVYRFPKSTTLHIVKILSGMEAEKVDDFATSMLGEMANIISGNAVSCLSEKDCRCDIKPPQITIDETGRETGGNEGDLLLRSPAGVLREHIDLTPAHF